MIVWWRFCCFYARLWLEAAKATVNQYFERMFLVIGYKIVNLWNSTWTRHICSNCQWFEGAFWTFDRHCSHLLYSYNCKIAKFNWPMTAPIWWWWRVVVQWKLGFSKRILLSFNTQTEAEILNFKFKIKTLKIGSGDVSRPRLKKVSRTPGLLIESAYVDDR